MLDVLGMLLFGALPVTALAWLVAAYCPLRHSFRIRDSPHQGLLHRVFTTQRCKHGVVVVGASCSTGGLLFSWHLLFS